MLTSTAGRLMARREYARSMRVSARAACSSPESSPAVSACSGLSARAWRRLRHSRSSASDEGIEVVAHRDGSRCPASAARQPFPFVHRRLASGAGDDSPAPRRAGQPVGRPSSSRSPVSNLFECHVVAQRVRRASSTSPSTLRMVSRSASAAVRVARASASSSCRSALRARCTASSSTASRAASDRWAASASSSRAPRNLRERRFHASPGRCQGPGDRWHRVLGDVVGPGVHVSGRAALSRLPAGIDGAARSRVELAQLCPGVRGSTRARPASTRELRPHRHAVHDTGDDADAWICLTDA